MLLSFVLNNIQLAFDLLGAIAFLMAGWLMLDTYYLRAEATTLSRAIGLALCAVWEVIRAIGSQSDVLSYVGVGCALLGLFLIGTSFIRRQQLHVQAVIVIPAFTVWSSYLFSAVALLCLIVAAAAYYTARREMNRTWVPFSLGFLFLGLVMCARVVFPHYLTDNTVAGAFLVGELIAYAFLAHWVWQYLQLRVRESLVLILISSALFLSTVVTLAFSTILISQINATTEANLSADVRTMSLVVDGLKEESLAKARVVATNPDLALAVAKKDFSVLELLAEDLMEKNRLGFLTIADRDGTVLVRAHALSRRDDSLVQERVFEESFAGESFVTVESDAVEKFSIRAGAPIIADKTIVGVVVAGFPLDNAFVDGIKRITGLEMFVYEGDRAVATTAFAPDGRTRLTNTASVGVDVGTIVIKSAKPLTTPVMIRGQSFLASYLPLKNGDDAVIGMLSAAKPQQDILDLANATNRLTLVTIIGVMLVLLIPIYFLARRLTEEV